MIFEGVACLFGIVLAMIVRRDNLVFDITGCYVLFQNGGGFIVYAHEFGLTTNGCKVLIDGGKGLQEVCLRPGWE